MSDNHWLWCAVNCYYPYYVCVTQIRIRYTQRHLLPTAHGSIWREILPEFWMEHFAPAISQKLLLATFNIFDRFGVVHRQPLPLQSIHWWRCIRNAWNDTVRRLIPLTVMVMECTEVDRHNYLNCQTRSDDVPRHIYRTNMRRALSAECVILRRENRTVKRHC